ncbi:ficolin-1-like [Anopheles funestus]|uniref:ficolin-1-like n=1 Tax=Anopheles funestus TaxID=62324 RepID=UPI0020C6B6E5|nr:ficolin-1-like [Anopheles funestus]
MFKINALFALILCCTFIGMQCDLTASSSCPSQDGFAFEMFMPTMKFLEECWNAKRIRRSCAEVPCSGIYTIQPEKPFEEPMTVLCDQEYNKGGWIVIQHRFDGSMNFFRNWKEYKHGFGNLDGEFWLGLDRIYHLTVARPHEVVFLLEDFDGVKTFAKYDLFEIGDEDEKYVLKKLGGYSGTAGDSLGIANTMKFSTFDSDNDTWEKQCAAAFTGAWWYSNCHSSNLNGKYLRGTTAEYATGMVWKTFRGYYYSLKVSKIMIRPKMP